MRWQRLHVKWCQWYLLPTPSLIKSCRQPNGVLWMLWSLYVIFFVPYSFCMLQQNIKATIWNVCGLLASYQWLLYI
jgi:hypothetical protein